MRRKALFCTFALTATLLGGCAQKNAQNPGNSTTPNSTNPSTTTEAPQTATQSHNTNGTTQSNNQANNANGTTQSNTQSNNANGTAQSNTQSNNANGTTQSNTQSHSTNGTTQSGTTNGTTQSGNTSGTTQSGTTNGTTQSGNASGTTQSNTQSGTASGTKQSRTGTTQGNQTTGTKISEEEAKKIALSHAGVTADKVTFIKSGIDKDDGQEKYDVEFYSADKKEYDCEIDPYTGEVLAFDYDAEYYPLASTTTKETTISTEEAKKIALAKISGATEKDIREFKSDYDNSKLQYEGKIYYNQKEYEFEIDGHTGDILEWDVETINGGTASNR